MENYIVLNVKCCLCLIFVINVDHQLKKNFRGSNMVSNEEIRIRLAAKREGIDPEEAIESSLETQRPFEWVGSACIIDFNSWPVEDLSITIKNLFEGGGYHLEEGTPTDGIYDRGHASSRLLFGYIASRYRFKVEIYSEGGNTFVKAYKAMTGIMEGIIDGWQGLALYNKEFYRLIEALKYLKPDCDGYLVCDKCNEYYKFNPASVRMISIMNVNVGDI